MKANEVKKGNVKVTANVKIRNRTTEAKYKGFCNGKIYGKNIYVNGLAVSLENIIAFEYEIENTSTETKQSVKTENTQKETVEVVYRNNRPVLVSELSELAQREIKCAYGEKTEYGTVYNFSIQKAKSFGLI